jgi:cytochrome c biogenesis factor
MLSDLGRLALALGALFGAWSVVSSIVARRRGREDIAHAAARGLQAATWCACFAVFVLLVAAYAGDTRVAFVAAHISVMMPAKYLAVALLSDPGGALPAFAAGTGLVAVAVSRRVHDHPDARLWATALASGAIAVALTAAAQIAPLDVRTVSGVDGRGLAPELQHAAAAVQGIAYLVGTSLAFAPFVLTITGLASKALGDAWSRGIRPWNAVTFIALGCGLVAGAVGAAVYPMREPWLSDRSTTVWLMVCALSAWLVQLDRGRQKPDRVVMRLLLTGAVFVAATAALALTGGGFVRPVVASAPSAASWFGIVPVAAISVLISQLRAGKGALGDVRAVTAEPRSRLALVITLAGIVLLAGAAAGSAWSRPHAAELGDTEILRIRDPLGRAWSFKSQGVSTLKRENFASLTMPLLAERDSTRLGLISAEARSYLLADESDAAEPIAVSGVRRGLLVDTRIAIANPEGPRPAIRITFVPLASWLWPGALLLWVGIVLYVVPRRETAA